MKKKNRKFLKELNGMELLMPMIWDTCVMIDGKKVISEGKVIEVLNDETVEEIREELHYEFTRDYGWLFDEIEIT